MRVTRPLQQLLIGCMLLFGSCSAPGSRTDKPVAEVETVAGNYPRFDRVLLLETTSETPAIVSTGDVNGDGHLDLVLATGRHWPLVDRVLLGDGRGQIVTAYDLGDPRDPSYSGR